MRYSVLFFLLTIIFSCKTQKNNKHCFLKKKKTEQTETTLKAIIIDLTLDTTNKESNSDAFKILDAKIIGNYLHLNISYSGGCEKHSFKINGDLQLSKSLPPIRSVNLIHYGNNDACKKLIIENLVIDIRDLAYKNEDGSEIFLSINGWNEKIHYVFKKK
ncbi:MAG: hypothetical protein EBR24_02665 [Flavobacteriia bacterium]|nr:hypothetical protein [Flavobacteriia bacterium]